MPEVLQGSCEHVSLSSLLQLAEAEGITGWLILSDHGRIGFRSGNLVAAHYRDWHGKTALWEFFVMAQGSFVLSTTDHVEGSPFGQLVGLIMHGVRLSDEWDRLSPLHFKVCTGVEPKVEDDLAPLLSSLDGTRSTREIVADLGVPANSVVDPVAHWLESFLIEEVAPPAHQTPSPSALLPDLDQMPFDDLMDQGRKLLREKQFDTAELCFTQAQNLRPNDRIVQQNLRRLQQLKQGNARSPYGWYRR